MTTDPQPEGKAARTKRRVERQRDTIGAQMKIARAAREKAVDAANPKPAAKPVDHVQAAQAADNLAAQFEDALLDLNKEEGES